MLPDFISVKDKMDEYLSEFMRIRERDYGVQTQRSVIFEGKTNSVTWQNGDGHQSDMVSVEGIVDIKNVSNTSLPDLLSKLDEAVVKMKQQMQEHMFATVSDICEKTGNVVDGKGQKLSAETILKALEKVDVNFDSNGIPQMPNIVCTPGAFENFLNSLTEIEEESFNKRWDEMIEIKRKEHNEREASRKLVG